MEPICQMQTAMPYPTCWAELQIGMCVRSKYESALEYLIAYGTQDRIPSIVSVNIFTIALDGR
jgi:hypothetical protein